MKNRAKLVSGILLFPSWRANTTQTFIYLLIFSFYLLTAALFTYQPTNKQDCKSGYIRLIYWFREKWIWRYNVTFYPLCEWFYQYLDFRIYVIFFTSSYILSQRTRNWSCGEFICYLRGIYDEVEVEITGDIFHLDKANFEPHIL